MSKFHELRDRVMSMDATDCRQELADTLRAMSQLESDFEVLLSYVSATTMQSKKTSIGEIMERRKLF